MPILRFSGGRPAMSTPSKAMRPASASAKPAMQRRVVVLPQPDGPSSDSSSASPISRLRPPTALAPVPYRFVSPSIRTTVIARPMPLRGSGHLLVPALDDGVTVLVGVRPVEDGDLLQALTVDRNQRLEVVRDLRLGVERRDEELADPFLLHVRPQDVVDPAVAELFALAALQHAEDLLEHEDAFLRCDDVDRDALLLHARDRREVERA